jgi:hypothetical protein
LPDRRRHRGPHPEDARLFASEQLPTLCRAVGDYSWLLTRRYAEKSALKLVGDHYSLHQRQRTAVMRCAAADDAVQDRRKRCMMPEDLLDRVLLIDGYNVLTTVEAALSGGALVVGRDDCLRDMASMHGSYRKVAETRRALELIGSTLGEMRVSQAMWFLDAPVSNSGRLGTLMLELAEQAGWPWTVNIVPSPDHVLIHSDQPFATADSVVLDGGGEWFNLAGLVVHAWVESAWIVDLRPRGE